MRPLPSPPTPLHSDDSSRRSSYSTPPSTINSFEMTDAVVGPRLAKARRREGHIFAHSASSSISSLDSSWSVLAAPSWMPEDIITTPIQATLLSFAPTRHEPEVMPPTRRMKAKLRPADIVIPRSTPSATIASPASPSEPKLPFPTVCLAPEAVIPRTPLSPLLSPAVLPRTPLSPLLSPAVLPRTPLSPLLSPLTPNRPIQTPTTRIRKLARLLGENVPVELIFPSGDAPVYVPPPPKSTQVKSTAKRSKMPPAETRYAAPSGPSSVLPRAPPGPEWPLTPTPDCTLDSEAYKTTAVGLHYALGMNTAPTRPFSPPPVVSTSPPPPQPFSSVVTMDSVSWESARQVVLGPRTKKGRRAPGGVHKAPVDANGIGTWRKKENTWSGEWNVEDMQELQVRLRRLR